MGVFNLFLKFMVIQFMQGHLSNESKLVEKLKIDMGFLKLASESSTLKCMPLKRIEPLLLNGLRNDCRDMKNAHAKYRFSTISVCRELLVF